MEGRLQKHSTTGEGHYTDNDEEPQEQSEIDKQRASIGPRTPTQGQRQGKTAVDQEWKQYGDAPTQEQEQRRISHTPLAILHIG